MEDHIEFNKCENEEVPESNSDETTEPNSAKTEVISVPPIFLLPCFVCFIDFEGLSNVYPLLCRVISKIISEKPETIGYWSSMCNSFAWKYGLWCRDLNFRVQVNWKKVFRDELWIARNKFLACSEATADAADANDTKVAFKVSTVCRFRPGTRGTQGMNLPLHQFLKLKRKQLSEKQAEDVAGNTNGSGATSSKHFVGEADPEEYLDPFLGSLMRDPVLLTTSGRIMERSVALECILRGGRDPVNNKKLTRDHLQPQVKLSQDIAEWRRMKEEKARENISVSLKDAQTLASDSSLDPELLETLLEAERLQLAALRAQIDAKDSSFGGNNWDVDNENVAARDHLLEGRDADREEGGGGLEGGGNYENENIPPGHPNQQLHAQDVGKLSSQFSDDHRGGMLWKKGESARVIEVDEGKSCVSMHCGGGGIKPFIFSNVHDGRATQESVYSKSVTESISAVLNGFNSTVLCYGQTGAGKTFTFFGPDGALDRLHVEGGDNREDGYIPHDTGMVIRGCLELLDASEKMSKLGIKLSLSAQFVEIFDEQVTDLLTGKAVQVKRENGDLVGASEAGFSNFEELLSILKTGHQRKRFAETAMNERSSRSHTAFIIQVTQTKLSSEKMIKSVLHLVDLAGSERVKKSKAEGSRMKEAVGINSSLLVLGKVIAALVESKHHVPYLESKLTTLLRGAFGGNCRTTCIINCRSDDAHGDETLQSLRFGERCAMISNTAKTVASQGIAATLVAIENALTSVGDQIKGLEARGKQSLDSYKRLQNSYQQLLRKRDDLMKATGISKVDLSAQVMKHNQDNLLMKESKNRRPQLYL